MLLAALLFLAGAPLAAQDTTRADGGAWHTPDVVLLGASASTLALDWSMTLGIGAVDSLHEKNWILGRHPSRAAVDLYFSLAEVGNVVIASKLHGWKRSAWLAAVTLLEVRTLHRGARFNIPLRLPL